MKTSDTPVGGPPTWWALRLALLALQSAVVTFLVFLCLIGTTHTFQDQVFQMLTGDPGLKVAYYALGVGLVFAAVLFLSWRLLSRSWPRITGVFLALAAIFAYLAHDDGAFRHPVTMEEISPVFPGAAASDAVLMRYGKNHPLGQNFKQPGFKEPYPWLNPEQTDKWRASLSAHRSEFEQHWAAMASERSWWAELNAFDRIGDLMPASPDGEIITFQVMRTLSQHGAAIASLQALDGHGDEAIDTLLPVLGVGRKIQPYSRTLVRNMIGIVIERMAINTANFILDNAPVSAGARARLAAALQGGEPGAGARHLFAIEYALHYNWMSQSRIGDILQSSGANGKPRWLTAALDCLSPVLYNPRLTFNQMGDLYADWEELAAQRKLDQLDARWASFYQEQTRLSPKNLLGRLLLLETIPAYAKVTENYWKTEDLRAALLVRLAKP
jgi:hypothetical protein